ncbi:MAG: hypothetical protein CBC23_004115 [Rhodospirillaceae bacterium TMED63]|nr:MAG: hypothetical protein CBC23_004115 [Rhodospirillaceae bacterium TMED63]
MCGVFGFILAPGSEVSQKSIHSILNNFFKLSEKRGSDAAGLALMFGDTIEVFKRPGQAHQVIGLNEYRDFVEGFIKSAFEQASNNREAPPIIAIGHSRLVTNGAESASENNQPVISAHSVGIHNGIVVNQAVLWDEHPDLSRHSDLDSEIIFALIDKYCEQTGDLSAATAKTFSRLNGSASIAMMSQWSKGLLLATNTGSLYSASIPEPNIFLFASEQYTLRKILEGKYLGQPVADTKITPIPAGNALIIDEAAEISAEFSLIEPADNFSEMPSNAQLSLQERTVVSDNSKVPSLRRCSRCVLPETFPFISFDERGVCNVCKNHQEKKTKGIDALRKVLDRHRRSDGLPDCLVAFSGGRDSSYGLHFISEEMGMTPIAFTYDWGMVTDLARRNQARICGKLGIDHVIRSPHIPTKRRNIRFNLEAWLHRPVLGIIPLLMAGDKQMFQVARNLRKETGVDLVLFCAGNELERTEFKTGFCGIRENAHGQVFWRYSLQNKIKLAAYYARHFIRNPRYINRSIPDTISAYYSTYIGTDNFVYLYHYLDWDEGLIDETLTKAYDWETADDSSTTWRVGDGTAAFYNYIYHTVAGFSEHDTFRSNQIRAGLIDREEALKMLEIDNRPRYQSMRSYASLVGFSIDEALMKINSIPKLY